MARSADPLCYAAVVAYVYNPAILLGVLMPGDRAVRGIVDALRIAERSSDDLALTLARATLGAALVYRQTDAERDRGQQLLAEVSDGADQLGHARPSMTQDVYMSRGQVHTQVAAVLDRTMGISDE